MTPYGQNYNGSDRRTSGARPQFADMTVGDYANGMPSIRIGEMIKSLMRQFIWIIPMLLLGAVAAFFLTKGIKRTYQGEGQVMAQLGTEYVFDPVSGQASSGGGLMLTPDIITLNEARIMKSQEVIQNVKNEIEKANLQQVFAPKIYADIAAAGQDPVRATKAQLKLHEMLEKNFTVSPVPKSFVIDLTFKHENGPVAVEVTKMFINAYLKQRQSIFVDGSADVISERRKATEAQLRENEEKIQTFLKRNNISDFDSERAGATSRLENLRAETNALQAQISETEAALASVEAQLRSTAPTYNIYVDDSAGQRVAQAELELKDLLARYLPDSDPVREKRAQIAQIKSLQATRPGEAIGGRRVGENPVYQELLTRRNFLQSTADSFREKEFALQRQLVISDAKVKQLQQLSPAYQVLLREQAALEQRHTGYTAKEQEALINQSQSDSSSENVTVISWPDLPRKGKNMRAIMFLLIVVGWGFTLFMAALLRVFLDPKLYGRHTNLGRRNSDQNGYGESRRDDRRGTSHSTAPAPYIPEPVAASPAFVSEERSHVPQTYQPGASTLFGQHGRPEMYGHSADTVPVIGTLPSSEYG